MNSSSKSKQTTGQKESARASSSSSVVNLTNDDDNNSNNNDKNIEIAKVQIAQLIEQLRQHVRTLARYQSMEKMTIVTPPVSIGNLLTLNPVDAYTAFQLSQNYILEQSEHGNSPDVLSAIKILENVHHYEIEKE